mgnify:CR=1 FL=1
MKSKVKISFGSTALFDLSKKLLKSKTSSIFILVDSNTKKLCLSDFISQTKFTNYELIEMHAGEEFKNIKTCEVVLEGTLMSISHPVAELKRIDLITFILNVTSIESMSRV